ncbi:MAG: hypothetical protein Q9225_005103 [Loekoesia sp. 1 TL-2023]
MHSPVLINYDPVLETNDPWSDWEYYSDDFYDSDEPKPKRRKTDKTGNGQVGVPTKPKRRKLGSPGIIPELSLGDPLSSDEDADLYSRPTVIWKSRGHSPKLPVQKAGQEEKVSILKDWKDRFKPPLPSKITSNQKHQGGVTVLNQHNPNDDTIGGNTDATASTSCLTRKRPLKAFESGDSSPSGSGGEGTGHVMERLSKKSMRKKSSSLDPPPEPVLVNGISSMKGKRKRQSNEDDEMPSPRKTRARRGSRKPLEAEDLGSDEAIDDDDGARGSVGEVANPTVGGNGSVHQHKAMGRPPRKRKLPPAHEDPVSKPNPKRTKSKPSEDRVTKEGSPQKATSAARRSTRRK